MLRLVKRLAPLIVMLCMLGMPLFSLYAAQLDYDISVQGSPISFSPAQFYLGETTRIYGTVNNLGNKDTSGHIGFYQGTNPLGEPQFFSSKADGASEDFWIDWTPTIEGTYNIALRLIKAEPQDQNVSNDTMVSRMITVTARPAPTPPPTPTPSPSLAANNPTRTADSAPSAPSKVTTPKSTATAPTKNAAITSLSQPQKNTTENGTPVAFAGENDSASVPTLRENPPESEVAFVEAAETALAQTTGEVTASQPMGLSTLYVMYLVGGVLLALLFLLIGAWLLKKSRQVSEHE